MKAAHDTESKNGLLELKYDSEEGAFVAWETEKALEDGQVSSDIAYFYGTELTDDIREQFEITALEYQGLEV